MFLNWIGGAIEFKIIIKHQYNIHLFKKSVRQLIWDNVD